MDNSKTIVCPNCGAVSSNLDNCEYCGSILVKVASIFHEEGKDVTKQLKELGIGKSVYVNPTILGSVEKNTNRSKRFNTPVECIYPLENKAGDGWLDNISIIFHPDSTPTLRIKFLMTDYEENRLFKHFEEFCNISRLFEITQVGSLMICSMQMDDDIKTTAQIIVCIIKSPFGLVDNDIFTSEYITLNGAKYLIVTESQRKYCEEWLEISYKKYIDYFNRDTYYESELAKRDEKLCEIFKESKNVNAWEFAKQQELKRRFKERYNEIANIKHFITTNFWVHEFCKSISYTKYVCRYWIGENATEEDIKRIEQNNYQGIVPSNHECAESRLEEIKQTVEARNDENAKNTTVGCLTVIGVIILVIILCTSC